MKKLITAFVFCFLIGECFSQSGEWVWIKGDSVPNQPGNFGVQGFPSPTNNPPSLYEPCEWTDLNGNFWLFGGYSYNGKNFGDLWKYDLLTNEWTWMKGSSIANDPGNYGTQGISSPTNNPPSRGWGATSWMDDSGNLWMFGGNNGFGALYNDLWKYDIQTNEWTWMKGSNLTNQTGFYGTQGVADTSNNPSARCESAGSWLGNGNELWLFGGFYIGVGVLNDLWRFDITTNNWTWMKGSSSANQLGVYGTLATENIANTPGARYAHCHWKDSMGRFWLYGGTIQTYLIFFSDLWRYNPITNCWAWMSGGNSGNEAGIYGSQCVASSPNMPGSRFETRASWSGQNDNFWLFGGISYGFGFRNDLWMYTMSANQWTWVRGDSIANPAGNWGTFGVSNPANKPNGRSGSVGWKDNNCHLYFFGGYSYSYNTNNDLWKYTIDTTCGVCPTSTAITENNPPKVDQLLVFPNPTNSSFIISFSSSEKQSIELRIYNTLGKQIYFSKEEITKGKFEKEINVEKWSDGIYFLQVKMKEGMVGKKVVVEK